MKKKIELSEFHCDMSNRVNRMNVLFILLSEKKMISIFNKNYFFKFDLKNKLCNIL